MQAKRARGERLDSDVPHSMTRCEWSANAPEGATEAVKKKDGKRELARAD